MTATQYNDNPLKRFILAILKKFPLGLSEFNLIQELKIVTDEIPENINDTSLTLFQTHFLLFNALYQLQTELAEKGEGYLEIEPLKISLISVSKGECNGRDVVEKRDEKLRVYYLDMSHLETTEEEDVNEMLDSFWQRFYAAEDRAIALQCLELEEPVSYESIRKQYRLLAKQYHPDSGGEKEQLQEINRAMEVLESYYGPCKM